ncbi:MAG: hypothetical protein C4B58_07610 [Deltaproteobacteria bacterium]|nr:MAG: hypothetical protein C4B58_07610 [Deltaproteobacteria bacterium]
MEAFVLRVQSDEDFVNKLVEFSRAKMNRNRKKHKELVVVNGDVAAPMKKAAQQKICQMPVFTETIFQKPELIV